MGLEVGRLVPVKKKVGVYSHVMEVPFFGKRDNGESGDDALAVDAQVSIASELSLSAAVDMIVFLKTAWNELVSEVEAAGIYVGITAEAEKEYLDIMARLRASLIVMRETEGFPDGVSDAMKGFAS
jgi:hypothetical protein